MTLNCSEKTKEIGDKQKLQDDIDTLVKWSEKWQMLFNFWKCKCLHTGSGNTSMNYEMVGTITSKTLKEKDLGVLSCVYSKQPIVGLTQEWLRELSFSRRDRRLLVSPPKDTQ